MKTRTNQPKCDSITDSELSQTISWRWPITDGVATIPYGFSTAPFWKNMRQIKFNPKNDLIPASDSHPLNAAMRNLAKESLKEWEQASNGTIKFVELKNEYTFRSSQGIFFYLSDNNALPGRGRIIYNRIRRGFLDELIWALNFNHWNHWVKDFGIENFTIFLDTKPEYWNDMQHNNASAIHTMKHEIGHALGFDHLHDFSSIRKKLENIPDSFSCSVMPYPKEINSSQKSYQLGELDYRLVKLSYQDRAVINEKWKVLSPHDPYMIIVDTIQTMCRSGFQSFVHQSLFSFAGHLTYRNKYIFSKKTAENFADVGMITIVVALDIPLLTVLGSIVSLTVNNLPFSVSKKLPPVLQNFINNPFDIMLLRLLFCVYTKEQEIIPFIASHLTYTLGSLLGNKYGRCFGARLAKPFNCLSNTSDVSIKNATPQFFTPPIRKESFCTRMTNWFCSSSMFSKKINKIVDEFDDIEAGYTKRA